MMVHNKRLVAVKAYMNKNNFPDQYSGTPPTVSLPSTPPPPPLAPPTHRPREARPSSTYPPTGTFTSEPPAPSLWPAFHLGEARQSANGMLKIEGKRRQVALPPAEPYRLAAAQHVKLLSMDAYLAGYRVQQSRAYRSKYLAKQAKKEKWPGYARGVGVGLGENRKKKGAVMAKVREKRRLLTQSVVRQRSLLGWEVVREGDEERKGGVDVLEMGGKRTEENRGLEFVPWGRPSPWQAGGEDEEGRFRGVEEGTWGEDLMEMGRYGGEVEEDDEVLSELESEEEEEEQRPRRKRKVMRVDPAFRRVTRSMAAAQKKEEELGKRQTRSMTRKRKREEEEEEARAKKRKM